ncbi:MAG: tetratricopeptide repeat protein [Candidatus Omnitrophota bacterium]
MKLLKAFMVLFLAATFMNAGLSAEEVAAKEPSEVAAAEKASNMEVEEFDFANGLFSRDMFDMAVDAYEDFLKKYPKSQYAQTAFFRMAECCFLAKKYDKALKKYGDFIEKYPESGIAVKALLRKGQIYYLKNDYKKAESILTDLVADYGAKEEAVPARYYMASIFFNRGDYTASKNMLENLLAENAGEGSFAPYIYMNLGDTHSALLKYTEAGAAYEKTVELSENDTMTGQAVFRAARAYYLAGEDEKAAAFYTKVTERPESAETFDSAVLGLVSIFYNRGELENIAKVVAELLPRVESDDVKSQVLFIFGNSYFFQNFFDAAEKVYTEAAEKYPNTEFGQKSVLNKCWAIYKLGKFDECVSAVDGYLGATEKEKDEALFIRGKAFADGGKTEEALKAYEDIIKWFKDSEFRKEALYESAWLSGKNGRAKEALNSYETFMNAYPEDPRIPEVLFKKGRQKAELKDYKGAVDDYGKFLEEFKDNRLRETVVYYLGMARYDQEDYDGAIASYKQLIEEFPASEVKESAFFLLAGAYQKKEEWDHAIAIYSQLILDKEGKFYEKSMEQAAYSYFQAGRRGKSAEIYYTLIDEMAETKDFKLSKGVYEWTADYYLNNGASSKSLEILEKLKKVYPEEAESGDIFYMYAENYLSVKETDKAVENFNRAIDKGIESPYLERAYLGLGRAYLNAANHEKALEFLNKTLEGQKDNLMGALARMEIGNVRVEMKEFEEAAKQYMMVGILYDDKGLCPMAFFQAGTFFEKAGLAGKALEAFRELVSKYPDNELVLKAKKEIKRMESET